MEIPRYIENLDAPNTARDLQELAAKYQKLADNFAIVASYARIKAIAVRNRAAGKIARALDCEMDADALYATLDDAFKW